MISILIKMIKYKMILKINVERKTSITLDFELVNADTVEIPVIFTWSAIIFYPVRN